MKMIYRAEETAGEVDDLGNNVLGTSREDGQTAQVEEVAFNRMEDILG